MGDAGALAEPAQGAADLGAGDGVVWVFFVAPEWAGFPGYENVGVLVGGFFGARGVMLECGAGGRREVGDAAPAQGEGVGAGEGDEDKCGCARSAGGVVAGCL